MIPTIDDVVSFMGIRDYRLAGYIIRQLGESAHSNGLKFAEAIVSEIGQPYETGFYKGCTGWTKFKKISPSRYEQAKWGMWKSIYSEASRVVSAKIGPIEVVDELFLKSQQGSFS